MSDFEERMFSIIEKNEYFDELKSLFDIVDPNVFNHYLETPLHLALKHQNTKLAEYLLIKGANINMRNIYGDTPLHLALTYNDILIAKKLIEMGADITSLGQNQLTPLHLAVELNNYEMSKKLVLRGSNVNTKGVLGITPLHLAVLENNYDICTLLIKNGANIFEHAFNGTPYDLSFGEIKTYMTKIYKDPQYQLDIMKKYFEENVLKLVPSDVAQERNFKTFELLYNKYKNKLDLKELTFYISNIQKINFSENKLEVIKLVRRRIIQYSYSKKVFHPKKRQKC